MQFIYGMGAEAFEKRAAELATKFGEGFKLTDAVKATIRKYEPKY
jgi:3-hydroxyacyl-CoA dehydrogenase/enoyl-CoA hydratase/3-hydroxybutyryl-CoA epimerase